MGHELLGRKAELAVSVLPIDHPNLIVEPFATGQMVCILPTGHPLAAQAEVGLAELAAYRLVLYSRNIPFGQLVAAARAGLRAGAGGRRGGDRGPVLGRARRLARAGRAAAARIDSAGVEPGAVTIRCAQPPRAAFRAGVEGIRGNLGWVARPGLPSWPAAGRVRLRTPGRCASAGIPHSAAGTPG
ncbi:hypothetical protein G6F57_019879 [Rhizopus arrhizus]|nr:hypothetical protein G6F57_019879 [Rhizopus arrhizus]